MGESADTLACVHAAECAGCGLIALDYPRQLDHKHARVAAAFARYTELAAVTVASVHGAVPRAGYRTRAKLVLGERGELGLYAAGTHRVVDIPHCRVLAPGVERVVNALRTLVREGLPGVTALDVRELSATDSSAPQAIVTWVAELDRDTERALCERTFAVPGVAGVAVAPRDPARVRVLGAAPQVALGPAFFEDRLEPTAPFALVTHGSFVQAHRGQAAELVRRVCARVTEHRPSDDRTVSDAPRVLELYAGSGFLALSLAQRGAVVTSVESFAPAAEACDRAARRQGLHAKLRVRAGDASVELRALADSAARFDAVVVNPPRRGLTPHVRAELARLAAPLFAYVSCDPDTLARDLAAFAQLGFATRDAQPFDLIPQSAEVETLVFLAPHARPALPVLYEDATLLVVHKPPHLPTTPPAPHADSVVSRVVATHGLAQADIAAVHRLDAGTSGVCLIAKQRAAVAEWSSALAQGKKRYLALARGVTHNKGKLTRALTEGRRTLAATTRFARKTVVGGHSLLRVSPEQGRTHQIRKHLASIGHPVLGDARYGHAPSNRHLDNAHGLDRPFLHLQHIELTHPTTGATLQLEAPLAGDLEAVLAGLSRAPRRALE